MFDSRSTAGAGLLLSLLLATPPALAATVISEVLYDPAGSDNGKGFVELFGSPGDSLDGLILEGINGSGGGVTHSLALAGVIPADGVFVIADDATGGGTEVAEADWIASLNLQNGPDSVVLRLGTTILDAMGYGDFSGLIFAGEGSPAPDVSNGTSLARIDPGHDTNNNLLDFELLATPTPGFVPAQVSSVPLPAAAYLLVAGLGVLSVAARRPAGWL